ncbi:MAG TPA: hypothetical protein VJ850_09365 [Candidatus Limnocylindrales bacterium]|nr:hypothetical protein [Candidatus Limnocylindrales bacterium]
MKLAGATLPALTPASVRAWLRENLRNGDREAAAAAKAGPGPAGSTPRGRLGRPWNIVLPVAFALGAENSILHVILEPRLLGSHAWIYTDAARALFTGGDPWRAGPEAGVFAGPPPMLIPFIPFVGLSDDLIAAIWLFGSILAMLWLLRKLGLPGYWIAFNPLFAVVVLGHLELLLVIVLLYAGRLGGVSAIVKPYMGFALVAQRRWGAIAVAVAALAITAPFLPWQRFIEEYSFITANLTRQYAGDSVFGNPVLMVIAGVALLSLGWRRALWLGAPVFWPSAQQGYKLMSMPVLTPVIAVFWGIPVPGMALTGIVLQAVLERIDDRRPLPAWLHVGLQPLTEIGASIWPERLRLRRVVAPPSEAATPAASPAAT